MGELLAYAESLVERLRTAGIGKATTRPSAAVPPCVLVECVPSRQYDGMTGSYKAAWSVVCLAPGPADEKAAAALESLVDVVARVLPIETASPATYRTSTSGDPLPAVLCRFTSEVTP